MLCGGNGRADMIRSGRPRINMSAPPGCRPCRNIANKSMMQEDIRCLIRVAVKVRVDMLDSLFRNLVVLPLDTDHTPLAVNESGILSLVWVVLIVLPYKVRHSIMHLGIKVRVFRKNVWRFNRLRRFLNGKVVGHGEITRRQQYLWRSCLWNRLW